MVRASRGAGDPVNLADVPPFRLGDVEVHPSTRQLIRDGRSETLEPRVMQVLVVLAEAKGSVISRDELIERCWGGRIVGENAINRVISIIRQTATDLGMDSFQLETITKVGYRMVVPGGSTAPETSIPPSQESPPVAEPSVRPSRRRVIGASVAAGIAVAAGGLFIWDRTRRHQPHPEALELYQRGQIAQRQGVPEQVRQAISFFTQATEIDPLYADAWGGLALSYRHVLEGYAEGELGSLPGLIESAGRRALALDPDNADAQVALVIIKPYFRNWDWMEADLRRLGERYPDHWFVQAQLGIIRYEVGRWRDGIAHTERQLEIEPFIPIPHITHARALWSLGRLQEAEAVLDAAVERWPAHHPLWNLKFRFLLSNGRPASAAAFVLDPETQPDNLGPKAIETRLTLARAVEKRDATDVAASLAEFREQTGHGVESILGTAPVFVLLGRPDLALDGLERYYLGAEGGPGPPVPPPGPYDRRYTQPLFMPETAPLRDEPRFARLLQATGLEDYWRATRTLPDYRRGANPA